MAKARTRMPKGIKGIDKLITIDKELFIFLEKISKANGESLNKTINRILGYAYDRKEKEEDKQEE